MLDLENPTLKNTYNAGDVLAITIAPDDKHQYVNAADRYTTFITHYEHKLSTLLDKFNIKYYFTLELSEPIGKKITNYPRLHLHGVIYLKKNTDVFFWLSVIMLNLLDGAILSVNHINSLEDFQTWWFYCHVQSIYMPAQAITCYVDKASAQLSFHELFSHEILSDSDENKNTIEI